MARTKYTRTDAQVGAQARLIDLDEVTRGVGAVGISICKPAIVSVSITSELIVRCLTET
ncbi:MAG TPA: hypothetical protein VKD04_07675 [Burkholderiales bacterium]|nr:hypothetical protein [Burkholderiales bacterium]